MMMPKVHHHVPSLHSTVIGELDQDAGFALFRGIPYASVEKRWTHSRTNHSLRATYDATEFGPRCVQGEGPVMVAGGASDAVPGDDEFKCLNLNVCVPLEALPSAQNDHTGSKLPVMVWIHGGAFTYGANSLGRYRPQQLSLLARSSGSPIILVQITYRLGALGFAASSDLESELESGPEVDGDHPNGISKALLGNYGLVDQRNAFDWVRSHISDFGGDPSNVTAFGISAGSASIHAHILTGDPLFDRGILMSGAGPTLLPLPMDLYEQTWQTLCQNLDIHDATPSARLERLRAIKPEAIAAAYPDRALGPFADGTLLPTSYSSTAPQAPTRCKAIILGDSRVEGLIMDHLSHKIPQPRFHALVHNHFPAPEAASFLQHFHFTATPTLSHDLYRSALRHFLSILMFQYPNLLLASSFPDSAAYLYHFEEPSPYPGPTFGLPYHGQCALFMFQNENARLPSEARRVAEELGRKWTAFAHGQVPWEESTGRGERGRFMRFGPRGESKMCTMEEDEMRDYGYLEWLGEHFEQVKEFAQGVMLGFIR